MRYFRASVIMVGMGMPTILALLLALNSHAAAVKGKIYAESAPEKAVYLWEKTEKTSGDKTVTDTKYTDLAGKPLVTEHAEYRAGNLQRYTYKQWQVDEGGSIEVSGNKVSYAFTAQGKESKEEGDLEENAIIPDMIGSHVQKHWGELLKGDTVGIRLMVLERQETVGFKFYLDKERDYKGKKAVDLVLKPSSFFIAMVAPNFRLTLEKEAPHRLLELSGVTPVREPEVPEPKTRKDYHAVKARVEYFYR